MVVVGLMVELVVVHAATFVHTLVEGLLCNMVCMSLFVLRGIFEGGEQRSKIRWRQPFGIRLGAAPSTASARGRPIALWWWLWWSG